MRKFSEFQQILGRLRWCLAFVRPTTIFYFFLKHFSKVGTPLQVDLRILIAHCSCVVRGIAFVNCLDDGMLISNSSLLDL